MSMRAYFAHSKLDYGTRKEVRVRLRIRQRFGDVLCPNRDIGERGSIAPYLEAIDQCQTVAVLEHGGFVGRGVFVEVEHALSRKKPVWALRGPDWAPVKGVRLFDPDDWKLRYGKLQISKQRKEP